MWNHPIDLHFYTSSLAGWPQLVLEVGSLDFYGGKHLGQPEETTPAGRQARLPCVTCRLFSRCCVSVGSLAPWSVGYGFCYLPSSSGAHDLEVDIWKPVGAPLEELTDFHLGGGPSLVDTEVIYQVNKAKEDRCHLFTQAMGTVRLHLEVTLRNFQLHKIKA